MADLLVFTAVFGETREGRVGMLAASRGSRAGDHCLTPTFLQEFYWK